MTGEAPAPVCQCNSSVTVYHPPVVTLQLMQILHQIVTNYECHGQPRHTTIDRSLESLHSVSIQCSVCLLGSEHKNMQISACLWCDDLAGYLQRDRAAVCRHVLTRHRTVTRRLHNININIVSSQAGADWCPCKRSDVSAAPQLILYVPSLVLSCAAACGGGVLS